MSQGLPVLALKKGGALETVVENPNQPGQSSGLFFEEATEPSLSMAIEKFETIENQFDPEWIRQHARSFGEDVFQKNISGEILDLLNRHN